MAEDLPLQKFVLWGEDHTKLGATATEKVGLTTAIALSRGRFPKGYAHIDPNEDAVGAIRQGSMTLLAVADGHAGFDAARASIEAVMQSDRRLLTLDPLEILGSIFSTARNRIASRLASASATRRRSRTSLIVAVISESRVVTTASLGDSWVTVVDPVGGARALGGVTNYLGPDSTLGDLVLDGAEVTDDSSVILCSDGLSDFLGRDWLIRLSELADAHQEPVDLTQAAIRAAFAGGAGDNIAVAVHRV